MKRLFSLFLAIALAISIAPIAFAAPAAQIYEVEDGLCDQLVTTSLVPGNSYYIELGPVKPDKTRYSLDVDDSYRIYDDKNITLVSSKNLSVVRKKISSNPSTYEYFAELKIKKMSANEYHEDGFYLSGSFEYEVGGVSTTLDVTRDVMYPAGTYDIDETPRFFVIDDEDDYIIDLMIYDGATLTVDSRGLKTQVLLAMDGDYNSSIGNQYPNADLDFLNGNGATFRRNCKLFIPADSGSYLYENKSGSLTDLTNTYNSYEGGFVVTTRTLGSYIVSTTRLKASSVTPSSSSSASSSSRPAGSISTAGSNLSNIITTFFKNKFVVINYGETHESLGKTVTLKAKIDLSHLNTNTLRVYAYDAAGYRLLGLLGSNARVDNDGYLYFNTSVKGYYVITDAPLA
jgi:hypothetical protein